MTTLELLAPAKNVECGMAAIDHGADAVYIGAARFGARASAGNSMEDIQRLCDYAHQFDARVYATLNTIIYDNELDDAFHLLNQLAQAGADAVLVQDMAFVGRSPLPLHASTQTDNRTPAKVQWLARQGFRRVVLARELTVGEIAHIHRQVPHVELEVFVHGALCVCYSGQCYASQYCFGRSANRGECAQFCRMKFTLTDADRQPLMPPRHLLSLKDMNQSNHLAELIEAGATSFKIEGRLKDLAYVKNVTAAYSQLLNGYIESHPNQYRRASSGQCSYTFTPDLGRTFNRGYTTYFLNGRQLGQASLLTPKALGQQVGVVRKVEPGTIVVAATAPIANGDGLCFVGSAARLEGFRVNRAEGTTASAHRHAAEATCRLHAQHMPQGLRVGLPLYRSSDQLMERMLSKASAKRTMPVTMRLDSFGDAPSATGFRLTACCGTHQVAVSLEAPHQPARTPQQQVIATELSKLGGTPFHCMRVDLPAAFHFFVPASLLSALRRQAVAALLQASRTNSLQQSVPPSGNDHATASTPEAYTHGYLYNVANHLAQQFYQSQGIATDSAFETHTPAHPLLMQCRYCLRHELGACTRQQNRNAAWRDPLYLQLDDGRRFRLHFDCARCQMNIYADE